MTTSGWPRQRENGIWMLTFSDRGNTGNLIFYTGEIVATRKIWIFFENFAINPFDTGPLAIFLLLENENLGIFH